MESVRQFLQENRLGHRAGSLLPHLESLGVSCLEDLLDVRREDLQGTGLSVIETNRFLRCVQEKLQLQGAPPAAPSPSTSSLPPMFSPPPSQPHPPPPTSSLPLPQPHPPPSTFSLPPSQPPTSSLPSSQPPTSSLPSSQPHPPPPTLSPPVSMPPQPHLPVQHVEEERDDQPRGQIHLPGADLPLQPANPFGAPRPFLTETKCSYVRYILCSQLFAQELKEKPILTLDEASHTMADLIGRIERAENISQELSLELYTHEGYPLGVNEFTAKCTLRQWQLCDGDLFYVFPRPQKQEEVKPPVLPAMETSMGDDVLTVESSLLGTLTVLVNTSDSVDTIYQAVAAVCHIPVSYMDLCSRRGYERLTASMELRSGDQLSLVLKNPNDYLGHLGTEFGKKTYKSMVEQTDLGLSKFYSILKFICSKERANVNLPRLLAYLLKLTKCPPMVYSLYLLYENSFLTLSGWVSLFEGCYQLFRHFLSSFSNVEDKRVFEFSDYFWGLIIEESEVSSGLEQPELDKINLVCPVSHLKIIFPVTIPGCTEVFDRASVLERIAANVAIPGCSKETLVAGDMVLCKAAARMIMAHPWHNEKEAAVWKKPPPRPVAPYSIGAVRMPCGWSALPAKLSALRITSPNGLFSGNECLTFIEKGQLVYFLGFGKSVEGNIKVYNPLLSEYKYYKKSTMEKIAKSETATGCVSHDLTKFLKPDVKQRATQAELLGCKPEPIVPQEESETVDWDPEEAIVVLLDVSGSMSESIFEEGREGLSRLQAAKDFFEAFANRSQAYDFHHSMGLTTFHSTISTMQPLSRIYEFFRESLDRVETMYRTCLNDAMMEAVTQLKQYTRKYPQCKRRILCLTDGFDNESRTKPHKVAQALQQEQVVVDTVLITDLPENSVQKAITHASGGACYLPKSRSEALKLFEMETLLSVSGRVMPGRIQPVKSARDMSTFESVILYPYNTGQLPSNFIKEVQNTPTASADKALRRADQALSDSNPHHVTPTPTVRRILREINEFRRNPHADIQIFPSEESVFIWKILMKGPEYTAYAGGAFLLCAKFPPMYPSKPPEIRFLTPIYHCNINSSGRICHRIFTTSYSPSITVRTILSCVLGLLMTPEPDDPLDSVLAEEYHSNRQRHISKAKEHTAAHAKKVSFADMAKELGGKDSGPDHLTCPLTKQLFKDPVTTPSGHTYERAAVMEYIREHGKDPLSKQKLKVSQLAPNTAMKMLVQQYKTMGLYSGH